MRTGPILALLLAALPAGAGTGAGDAGPPEPAAPPSEVVLGVGQIFPVCGLVTCPASGFCDDPKVASPVGTASGLGWKAIGVGATLCSAGSASGAGYRRVFRVTVGPARP